MALSLEAIKEIAARKGNKLLHAQINAKSEIARNMKTEGLDGATYVINVTGGGLSSVGMVADNGALPAADAAGAEQIQVRPVPFFANIAIGQLAAKTLTGKMDSIKLVEKQFEIAGSNLAHLLGTAIFGKVVSKATANATVTAGVLTLSVDDAGRYRRGMAYIWSDNGVLNPNPLVCTGVQSAADGSGTVTFSTSATGTFNADEDAVMVRGVQAHWCSLEEAAGSGDIYGASVVDADWHGNTLTANGKLTLPMLREMNTVTVERTGEQPDLYAMSPRQFQAYEDLNLANRRFDSSVYDPFAKSKGDVKAGGKSIVVDATCYNHKVFSLVKDSVKIGKFQDFKEYNEFQNSTTHYSRILQMDGLFNLLVEKRGAVTMLDGVEIDLHG